MIDLLNLGIPERVFRGAEFSSFSSFDINEQYRLAVLRKEFESLITLIVAKVLDEMLWTPFFMFSKSKKMARVKRRAPKYKVQW